MVTNDVELSSDIDFYPGSYMYFVIILVICIIIKIMYDRRLVGVYGSDS